MRRSFCLLLLVLFLLAACNPATPGSTPVPISIEYTAATIPWLAGIYDCAGANVVNAEQRAADFQDPQSYDLSLQIGQPENQVSPAYQIGTDEILLIVNSDNPVKTLSADQVQRLFTGQSTNWKDVGGSAAEVQVWVFSSGDDVQQIFEADALGGSRVSSTARLATSPEEMSQAIVSDVNAVGILTRRPMGSSVLDAFTVATAPVLALTQATPQGSIQELIACLQNNTP
jgi:hypothetical protein